LDILFKSGELQRLCHDDRLAKRALGAASAAKLRTRLDDLSAAANLDYARKLPGRFHGLKGKDAGCFAMDLHGGHRLVLQPATEPLPLRKDQSLDLSRIATIRVVFIGDYHD
jgi:toxin HigB-1